MGNVGDHAQVELAGIDAILRPTVRSGFEDNMRQPGSDHFGEVTLHFGRVRRGDVETGIEDLVADDGVDG